MVYVYLVYGLSFFILWTVLWLYHMKLGQYRLSRHLWLIGLFAVTHGSSDWMSMLVLIQGFTAPAVKAVSLGLMIASFLFLIEFGIHNIGALGAHRRIVLLSLLPLLLLVPVILITGFSRDGFLTGEIVSRYLLGIPGGVLTCYALATQVPEIKKIPYPGLAADLKLASVAFLFYTVFTGLIVPEAPFLPASVLNYRTFLSLTGIPVEIFRAVCVLTITYAMTRLLHAFELQQTQSMARTNRELEQRVTARTMDLTSLNETLRLRELQQKAILDNIPDIAWLKDAESRFIRVNRPFARSAGTTPEALTGKTDLDVWPRELAERYRADDRDVMNSRSRKQVEEPLIDKDGQVRWIETIKTPVYNERGEVIGTSGIARDVTGRKEAEEALRESENRYRAITENAIDGIVTIDRESRIVLANPAARRIFGYRNRELEGRSLTTLMPERLREPHRAAIQRYLATGKRHLPWGMVELPGLHRDGREIPLEMSYGEYRRNGERFFTGIIRDITGRKEMESALRESERLRQMVMDEVPALISYIGNDLRYRFVNRPHERWWRRPASDIIGRQIGDVLGEKSYRFVKGHVSAVLRGETVSFQMTIPLEQEVRTVLVTLIPHRTGDDRIDGFFSMSSDITAHKRAEEALIESEKRIQLIIDAVPAMISYLGTDLRYRFVNRQYEAWFHLPADRIVGRHIQDLQGAEEYREIESHIQAVLRGERVSYERGLKRDGERRFVHVDYVPHLGVDRDVAGFFTLITDITDRKKFEENLQQANEKLSHVLNSITEAYYAFDSRWRVIEMNREAEKLLGPAGEVVGKVYWERFPANVGTEIDRQYRRAVQEKRPVHFEARSGVTARWYELHAYPRGQRLEVYFRDITERKRLEEIVQHRAYHDPLTDLPNRLLFKDILELEVAQARRNRKKIAVLYLDLDRFKQINDTLGHDAGDQLLQQAARRLRKSIRDSDTVARIGGDEFNILLADVKEAGKITTAVRKITSAFREPFTIFKEEVHVTTSLGISIYPDDSRDAETLLKYADMAMYHAKETGRNRHQFYDRALNTRTLEHGLREKRLQEALKEEELTVYYLPEVDPASRKVIGAEALLRWKHPKEGLLSPARFLQLAEETGLIIPIGEWVLRKVVRQAKAWQQAGYRPISVTVNLSDRQFHQKDLAEVATKILQEAGLEPRWLEFEIAERTAMRDVEFTGPHLQKLIRAGVRLSLDNFGTGRLSLNQLKKLPFQKLKIDQSLIRDIPADQDGRMIVEAMIAMTHMMKLKAAAEGVETEEQFNLLREKHCDALEGYIFSRPQPAEEFEKMLVAQAE